MSAVHAVIAAAQECGDVEVERVATRTRLSVGGTEFASIEVGPRIVNLYLLLPGSRRVPGIVRLLTGGRDVARHRLRLRKAEDVNAEVRAWLCEAYAGAARSGHERG